jgi:hypothetical protein
MTESSGTKLRKKIAAVGRPNSKKGSLTRQEEIKDKIIDTTGGNTSEYDVTEEKSNKINKDKKIPSGEKTKIIINPTEKRNNNCSCNENTLSENTLNRIRETIKRI